MSAIKSILLHLDPSPRSAARVRMARELADAHGATVTAAYAATASAMQVPQVLVEGGSAYTAAEALDERRRAKAREVFDGADPGPAVTWAALPAGDPVRDFAREALRHDLLVLGQRDPADADSHVVPADFVESVIMASGRPALVVPYAGTFGTVGKTVLVAWKPTRETALAVSGAMPFLERADKVHVCGWGSDPRDLEHLLLRHGIDPALHREGDTSGPVGEYILSRAAELGADLLVMGCYGHSRARELVLGGASRTIMDSMTLPVLMAH